MTTTAVPATGMPRPRNVALGPGAMQNWSDLDHHPAGGSRAQRELVARLVRPEHRVAIVGPHSLDLVVGVASYVSQLTVIIRSIPDAVVVGDALQDHENVEVICACAATLLTQPDPFDVVIALDDLSRVWSLECEPMSWQQLYDGVAALVATDGTLCLGVENELGLHSMTQLRSRYTSDHDEDWSVTATFDATRPRSRDALMQLSAGSGATRLLGALPTWQEQTVLVTDLDSLSPAMTSMLGALTLGSGAFRRVGADPTRVTRAAVLSGRLTELVSGWVLVSSASALPALDGAAIIADDGAGRVATYDDQGGSVRRQIDGLPDATVSISASSQLVSGVALDLCAAEDLSGLRTLLGRFYQWLEQSASDGIVPASAADTRLDNVVLDGAGFECLMGAESSRSLPDAAWAALSDLVVLVRARGSRHPWPAATDDATMLAVLGAMVGLNEVPQELLVGRESADPLMPANDVAGLLAVIERLTATNAALSSRSRWFEERLNLREREMRTRAERHRKELELATKQQRILQDSAEDLRRSITFRTGEALINPIRRLGGNLRR